MTCVPVAVAVACGCGDIWSLFGFWFLVLVLVFGFWFLVGVWVRVLRGYLIWGLIVIVVGRDFCELAGVWCGCGVLR